MLLTRKVEFSAAHGVLQPGVEREPKTAGSTAAMPIPTATGTTYVWRLRWKGEPDAVTGMVFDLRELKEILNQEVVEPMDHRFLNREVPPFDA